MPFIQYPNVPAYPGVPQLVRPVSGSIASSPVLVTSLGILSSVLAQAIQQGSRWGIFDQQGNQIGIPGGRLSFVDVLEEQITGPLIPESTTLGFDFIQETTISGFPIEGGGFANFNKVRISNNPLVTLTLKGDELDRAFFLQALAAACDSTDLYNIVTPEVTYVNYSIESYRLRRTAASGATLLRVEVSLKEIRQVSAAFTQSVTPIVAPQNSTATPQTDNGKVQAQPPSTSTLKSLTNKFGALINQISGSQ